MKGTKRQTIIAEIFKKARDKVSPDRYKITKDAKDAPDPLPLGTMLKGSRDAFTVAAEWQSQQSPSAHYIDIYNKPVPERIFQRHKKEQKGWRVAKKDGPEAGHYKLA